MDVAAAQAVFDETLARRYYPIRVVKQAVLILVPDGIETTIVAEWGKKQRFVGSWYAIYNNEGKVKYGSSRRAFDETHAVAEEVENGYFKSAPIEAYQYRGPDARLVIVLRSGAVETENTVVDGAWMARWPHRKVGVIKELTFPTLYQVN